MAKLLSSAGKGARSRGKNRLALGFGLALLCWWLAPAIFGATFTAALDRDTVTLGESVTLSLTFSGGAPESPPSPPAILNLQIDYVGPSSQFSFINGQVSSTVTHNFTITPRQAGEFVIPAFKADAAGEKLATQPLRLRVLAPSAPPPQALNSGAELAFLKLALPKQELYLGEILVAELQLYVRNDVQRLAGFQLTSGFPADGFNVGKMEQGRQQRQARVGNAMYSVIPVFVPLKSVKTGPLTVGPVTANVVVEVASANRRRDVFDPFGMFGNREQKQFALATTLESVRSLPLPASNAPPSFNGAVGSYTMTATAGPTNLAAGDPITVRVQISGRGALDSLSLPEQTAWQDFKTFPPTTKLDTTDPLGLEGTKTFEQIVVPQSPEIKMLPAISFSFFDPEQKSYRTLTHPPIALMVRASSSAPAPTLAAADHAAPGNPPPAQDIVDIKQRLGTVAQIGPPLVEQRWFLALQGVPLLAWLSALVWRRRAESLANNPRLRRRRQVAQTVRDGLLELRRLAGENKSEEFFAALFRLLQEQLGERLDLPASAITEAIIEERLRPRRVPETTLTALQELFQICNLARYAPIKSSQELAALIPKFETVLREVQNFKL